MGEMTQPHQENRNLKGFGLRMHNFINRLNLSGLFGAVSGGCRDYYATFGWDRALTPDMIWSMYLRGGIASRVINAFPEAIWSRPPQLYVQGDAAWNKSFDGFVKAYDLWDVFRRADIMCMLGRFSVLVIGTNKGDLSNPQPNGAQITYLQPYSDKDIKVHTYVSDPKNPRFGKPLTYMVYPSNVLQTQTVSAGIQTVAPKRSSFQVHWTRCIHIAQGALETDEYGVPYYADIWNYLTDMQKVVGSSSESYWLNSFPGLHADIDKELELEAEDEANLTEEIDEYMNSFRRTIRTRGVKVTKLVGNVADPGNAFDVLLTLVAGTKGIPKRVLVGSEAGQLASTQDKGSWAERIEERRNTYCMPRIIIPFMRWLVDHKIMATNLDSLQVLWPEAYRMSPLERAQQGAQIARTLANIQKGLQPIIMEEAVLGTPATPERKDPVTGVVTPATPGTAGKPAVTQEPLLSRDEARKLLGLSTDQNLVNETPD